MNIKTKLKAIVKSLEDFIDAGASHAESDIDKLFLLTSLALHIEKRQKEIGYDSDLVIDVPKKAEEFVDSKEKSRVKKATKKDSKKTI